MEFIALLFTIIILMLSGAFIYLIGLFIIGKGNKGFCKKSIETNQNVINSTS